MNNPFHLFDLPVQFEIDQQLVSERYLQLQKHFHPDNFAASSAAQQRIAMQKSADVNDALKILKDPVLRAETIIQLHTKTELNSEQKTNQDISFLMEQLALREQLEEIENNQDIDHLFDFAQQITQLYQQNLLELSTALSQQDWQQAILFTDRLRFINKLSADIERVEDQLATI